MNKLCALVLYLPMMIASAAEVGELTIFSAGTPAKASEVNANFSDVKSAVNENHQRLLTVENGSTTQATQINDLQNSDSAHAASITTLQSNMSGKQAVLSNACSIGSAIRAIDPNGTVTCEVLEKSGKLILQPTEFHPTSENFAVQNVCQGVMGDSAAFGSGTNTNCPMLAAAKFPHGVTITSFQCFVRDTNRGVPSAIIYASFERVPLTDITNYDVVASTGSSGTTGSDETISSTSAPTNNIVDNNNYYYRVVVTFDAVVSQLNAIGSSNLSLHNCTADYTMP